MPSPEVIKVESASESLFTDSFAWDIKTPSIFNGLNKFFVFKDHASEFLNFPVNVLFMLLGLSAFFVILFKAGSLSTVPAMVDDFFVGSVV